MEIEIDLAVARRRAWALMPYSPAWDAAMAIVEDLERALWRFEHERRAATSEAVEAPQSVRAAVSA